MNETVLKQDIFKAYGIHVHNNSVNNYPIMQYLPIPETKEQKDILRAYGIPYLSKIEKNNYIYLYIQ